MAQVFSLGADSFFRCDGAPFMPVGVNYWPTNGASANEWWRRWPAAEIRADLAAIAAAGLNAVRVSGPDTNAMLGRVRELITWCSQHGLAAAFAGPESYESEGALPVRGCEAVTFSARPDEQVLGFDGLADPFFHTLLPFAVRRARLKGPVLITSLGVGATLGAGRQQTWLRAALPAARVAGAAGFFWADWRGDDGLTGTDGRIQAGQEAYCAYARESGAMPLLESPAQTVGVLFPQGRDGGAGSLPCLALAQYFLSSMGRAWRAVTANELATVNIGSLLVAGIPVTASEVALLRAWTAAGGELFWHGPDPLAWNEDLVALLGSRPVDWRSGRGISVQAFGERFTLAHFPHDVRAELETCGATVLAPDHQGFPLLLENRFAGGRVRYAMPLVEESIVPVAAHPLARDRWTAWYRGMLAG